MKNLISILTVIFCMVSTSQTYASYVKLHGQFENTNKNSFVEVKVSVYDYELEEWIQLDYYKVIGNKYSIKFCTFWDYKVTFNMVDKDTKETTEKNLYHNGSKREGKFASNYLDVDFKLEGDCVMEQNENYTYEFNKYSENKYPDLTTRYE